MSRTLLIAGLFLAAGLGAGYLLASRGAVAPDDDGDGRAARADATSTDDGGDDDTGEDAEGRPRPGFRQLPGRWRPAADADAGGTEDEPTAIGDLGYAGGYEPAGERSGVVFHRPELAQQGLNLCYDGGGPRATLVDMDGNVLHEWFYELRDLIGPEEIQRISETFGKVPDKYGYFRRAHALPTGELIAIFADAAVVKLSRDSEIVWSWLGNPHHDLWIDDETGRIHVLTRKIKVIPRYAKDRESAEDFITILSPDGELIDEISILEAFEQSDYASQKHIIPRGGDLQHTNTLEVLQGRLADRSPAFAKGNYLISCCRTDTIAVIDAKTRKVVWSLAGAWHRQHQPTILENGNMLLFDNRGHHNRSKVIEFDPFTQEIFWAYRHSKQTPFWTQTCGSNQRLENGNTLITETDTGRAFEVNREGKIVWEYYTPNRAGTDDEFIATLFEVIRLPADYFRDWTFE